MTLKKISLTILSIFILSLASGCNQTGTTTSSNTGTSSSTPTPIEYPSLSEAMENTQEYAVTMAGREEDKEWYFEIMLDDFYYYDPMGEGYIVLSEDPDYFHAVTKITYVNEDGNAYYELDVHGRRGPLALIENYYSYRLIDILQRYVDDFVQVDENVWSCSVAQLGSELRNYFQADSLRYSNYFEIEIGADGKLARFSPYEVSTQGEYKMMEIVFKSLTLEDYPAYQRWNENGRDINLKIYDLKMGFFLGTQYYAAYNQEEIQIQGTVTAIDENQDIYIANMDSLYGSVGLRVQLTSTVQLPSINDIIVVEGTIALDGYSTYLSNATYTSTGESMTYAPTYDEETIVDSAGGGVYAANFFSQVPYFTDSLYSTFAYIESMPNANVANEDTEITLICPTFVDESRNPLRMKLVLPAGLNETIRDNFLQTLKDLGIYQDATQPGVEISLQNVITQFDMDYEYHVVLKATENTVISKKYNFVEKVEVVTGYVNFPMPESTDYKSYRFGGSTGMFLEQSYNMDSRNTIGVYLYISNIATELVDQFIQDLVQEGFVKYDEVEDVTNARHQIYTKDDYVVDFIVQSAMFDYENKMISLWIYKGDILQKETIFEVVEAEVGDFFDVNDFIKLSNSYDADYTHFELINYAGRDFTKEDPLHVFTIDLNYNALTELVDLYRNEKGYSYYRNENNSLYTYITRGSTHYVLYKDIDNSTEKVFVDMAVYPTTDYTYAGHDLFTYRVEVLIYKGETPLSTIYENNLDGFIEEVCLDYGEEAAFSVSLPTDATIEYIKSSHTYDYIEYGYYTDAELFIYSSDVNEVYQALVDGLEAAGYVFAYSGVKSDTYQKAIDYNSYSNANICLIKDEQRGFVRVINGIGGTDF